MDSLSARLAKQLLANLAPTTEGLCVAFSGGLDSRVLLHLAYLACQQQEAPLRLRAVHVHHGFSANADAWADFCLACCQQLGIELSIHRVKPNELAGASLEDRARRARYAIFEQELQPNEILLQGHHQDDQVETLLLNLMRASGSLGLSGIPVSRSLGKGSLLRPLLTTPRQVLHQLAIAEGLTWIEDESNQENIYDRNFLRLEVLPLLEQRFPNCKASLARSSQLAATSQQLNEDLAKLDLATCQQTSVSLDLTSLNQLSETRQINLLRYWLAVRDLTLPGHKIWAQIFKLIQAKQDAQPLVSWASRSQSAAYVPEAVEVRRFNQQLFIAPSSYFSPLPKDWFIYWQGDKPLITPLGELDIQLSSSFSSSIKDIREKMFYATARQGGEVIELAGRGKRDVKRLLQEAGLPPWERQQQVFIWYQPEQQATESPKRILAAVGKLLIAKGFTAN